MKLGFQSLNEILMKDHLTHLDRRLLTSIRLFGAACDVVVTKSIIKGPIGLGLPSKIPQGIIFEEIPMNDRLLKLFTSLESLLIFDDEPITNNIAERSAFLLGNSYEERIKIKKFLKKMYKFRSAYIHHGECKVDYEKLEMLVNLVQQVILKFLFIKNEFRLENEKDLKRWFEEMKLSTIYDKK